MLTCSARETITSQCRKGKKRCADTEAYARMQNGDKFITTHVLTPRIDEILQAKTRGLLVAIDPTDPNETTNRRFFRVHAADPKRKVAVA